MILNYVKLFHNMHPSQSPGLSPNLAWNTNKWILSFQCCHMDSRMMD